MRAHEIENWVLNVIDRVEAGQPNEDFRVELKGTWIDAPKAARLIAGHANAARSTPILWIIGVDEKRGVLGVSHNDLANWYSIVRSQFDEGLAPALTDLNIPIKEKTVVALLFETDRAPFIVKNPAGGQITREVPWREGTRTDSATRSQLIRLLSPLQKLPIFEVLNGALSCHVKSINSDSGEQKLDWILKLELYTESKFGEQLVIPFHRCSALFEIPRFLDRTSFDYLILEPDRHEVAAEPYRIKDYGFATLYDAKTTYKSLSLTIDSTKTELIIGGSGRIFLTAFAQTQLQGTISIEQDTQVKEVKIAVYLRPIDAESFISIDTALLYSDLSAPQYIRWSLKPESKRRSI